MAGLSEIQDLDTRTNLLTKAIQEAIEKTVPLTEKIKKKWITEETLQMIQEKRRLRGNRDQSEAAEREYKERCKQVTTAVRTDRTKWLEQQCEELDRNYGEGKLREVYKMIRNVNREWQPKLSAIRDRQGKILTDKKEIRKRWSEYCSELYSEQPEQEITKREIEELRKISPPGTDREPDILLEEVEHAIKKLRNNKSPGHDNITAEMIKQGGEPLSKEIHKLCNLAWEQGRAPEEWKKIHPNNHPQERERTRLRELSNDLAYQPYGQGPDGDTRGKTEKPPGGAHIRRTSRVPQKQKYDTANSHAETHSRESETEKQKGLQLFCGFQKDSRQRRPRNHLGHLRILRSRSQTNGPAQRYKWHITGSGESRWRNRAMVYNQ